MHITALHFFTELDVSRASACTTRRHVVSRLDLLSCQQVDDGEIALKKSLRMYLNMHVLDIAWNGRGQEFSHWA
jgi:hypothetical protein